MVAFIAVVQFVLHYLGWIGIVLGAVALLFGNGHRGVQLLIGGFSFIVLKYAIGVVFLTPIHIAAARKAKQENEHPLDDADS